MQTDKSIVFRQDLQDQQDVMDTYEKVLKNIPKRNQSYEHESSRPATSHVNHLTLHHRGPKTKLRACSGCGDVNG